MEQHTPGTLDGTLERVERDLLVDALKAAGETEPRPRERWEFRKESWGYGYRSSGLMRGDFVPERNLLCAKDTITYDELLMSTGMCLLPVHKICRYSIS